MSPRWLHWPAAGGFLPSDVASLDAWWDASASATITESGGVITDWASSSSTSRTLTSAGAATVNSANLNGLDTIAVASDSFSTSSSLTNSAASFFIVLKPSNTNRFVTIQYSGDFFLVYQVGSSSAPDAGVGSPTYYFNGQASGWSTRDDVASDIGTSWSIVGVTGIDLTGWATIGLNTFSGYQMTGDYAEILFFSDTLSSTDREKIEGYLAHKWGLTASLPATHPYKGAAP